MESADINGRLVASASLIAELAALFAVDVVAWCDLGGSSTTNVRLRTRRRDQVARIHPGSTTPERLAAIQAARRAVAVAGLPAVPPDRSCTGQTVQRLLSGRLVEIEPFVPSKDRMNAPDALTIGFGLLAGVHDALREATLPAAARIAPHANHLSSSQAAAATARGAERIRGWASQGRSDFAERVLAHIDAVVAAEEEFAGAQLVQVVHGDFWDNNVLLSDGQIVAVLDFDFMAERARIDDLALPVYFYLLEPGHGPPGPKERRLLRTLVDAYDAQSDRPLALGERLALPLAIARQPAWSIGRWTVELDEPDARQHAVAAEAEFPVAQAVLADLPLWQSALTD